MNRFRSGYCSLIGVFYFALVSICHSEVIKTYSINASVMCLSQDSLRVISADKIAYLLGHPVDQLSFFSVSQGHWRPVVFQIDQKDPQGRYIIPGPVQGNSATQSSEINQHLGRHDELVFRHKDMGERLEPSSEFFNLYPLIEIELPAAQDSLSRWIYINLDPQNIDTLTEKFITYEEDQDYVTSSIYKIGFSKNIPFLVDAVHWWLPQQSVWSTDLSDMMKIRHKGKIFGLSFKRTHDDYRSRLTGIKKGPLRIIRRTENQIKVFWKVKTPALYIDYVMMPDGFVMDTMIDIPFKVSLFFNELETLTSMDWNNDPDLPVLTIHSAYSGMAALNLPVTGHSSPEKKAFNLIRDKTFSVSSTMGTFGVVLDIPNDFPIRSNLYINDALDDIDMPENYPGQYGNVGFRTTGWENIDTKLHHLKFTVCMKKNSASNKH